MPVSVVHIGNRHDDVLQVKCCAFAVLIKNMSITFISNKWETAMTPHGPVTRASLKQAKYKGIYGGKFFIRLHLKIFSASIHKISHSKLRDPKQYDIKV